MYSCDYTFKKRQDDLQPHVTYYDMTLMYLEVTAQAQLDMKHYKYWPVED